MSMNKRQGTKNEKQKGFTLIEIMTALSIFIIVITVSMGSIIGVFDTNRKSRSLKIVMSNLNTALETMSREIRFGRNYHCELDNLSGGNFTPPLNCNVPGGGVLLSFLSNDGEQIVYVLNDDGAIEASFDGGSSYTPITAPEINIQNLSFYVVGAGEAPANTLQPKVYISVRGEAGGTDKTKTSFAIQTMVSQRYLDNP